MNDKSNKHIIINTGIFILLIILFQNLRWIPTFANGTAYGRLVIGSLVNFAIILSLYNAGLWGALTVGAAAPLFGYLQGQVETAPLILVLIIANTLMLLTFYSIKQFGSYLSGIAGGILKWGAIAFLGKYIFILPASIYTVHNLPEIYTALVGAVLAVMSYKFVKDTLRLKRSYR